MRRPHNYADIPNHILVYIEEAVSTGLLVELVPGLYALTEAGFKVAGKSRPSGAIHSIVEMGNRALTIQHRAILMRLYHARHEGEPGLPGSLVDHLLAKTLVKLGLVEEFTPADQYMNWWRLTDLGIIVFAGLCRHIAQPNDGCTRALLNEADQLIAERANTCQPS